jgi:hypothetical protein
MKKILLICLFFVLSINAISQTENQQNEINKIRIFVSKVEFGPSAEEIGMGKIEAALLLAGRLTGKYEIIPFNMSDSIVTALTKNKKEPTAQKVADALDAQKIWTIRVDRLENMIRTNISQIDLKSKKKKSGIGYSLINYFEEKTNKRFYDPTILKCIQRSFASVVSDTTLFAQATDKIKVYPAKPLVVGGINFVDDKNFPKWDIFEKKMTVSYEACESMMQVCDAQNDICAYDLQSRDSIYAMFGYHLVENYHLPTTIELEALNKLEVDYFLTGWVQRNKDGAYLEILLYKLNGKGKIMTLVKSDNATISKDDLKEFQAVVKNLSGNVFKK